MDMLIFFRDEYSVVHFGYVAHATSFSLNLKKTPDRLFYISSPSRQ